MKDFGLYYSETETPVRVIHDSKTYYYEVFEAEKEDFMDWASEAFEFDLEKKNPDIDERASVDFYWEYTTFWRF